MPENSQQKKESKSRRNKTIIAIALFQCLGSLVCIYWTPYSENRQINYKWNKWLVMLLWLHCCTQIDFVYLFIFDCIRKLPELSTSSPQLLWLESFAVCWFKSHILYTSKHTEHTESTASTKAELLFDFTNLSDWITFCCIHQHFQVFCIFFPSAGVIRKWQVQYSLVVWCTLHKPSHRIICSFLVFAWFPEEITFCHCSATHLYRLSFAFYCTVLLFSFISVKLTTMYCRFYRDVLMHIMFFYLLHLVSLLFLSLQQQQSNGE